MGVLGRAGNIHSDPMTKRQTETIALESPGYEKRLFYTHITEQAAAFL